MKGIDLCTTPIVELQNLKFIIPAYQRGYRWTDHEVIALLDDLEEFMEDENLLNGSFYCLQPLVVKGDPEREAWEVIDGQQRLTTILLILKHLNQNAFSIEYETRKDSQEFLTNPTETHHTDNIDFHHIGKAQEYIKEWFDEKKDDTYKSRFVKLLLAQKIDKHIAVIWYAVPEQSKSVDIFIRLNIGKIPLNSAELIRATILGPQNDCDEDWKQRAARDWDNIEHSLQRSDFWCFLYDGDTKFDSRIEFLFELFLNVNAEKPTQEIENYTYLQFTKRISEEKISLEKIWEDIKHRHMLLLSWFEDPILYHLIGYLVCVSSTKNFSPIERFYAKWTKDPSITKTSFRIWLRKEIRTAVFKSLSDDIDQLIRKCKYRDTAITPKNVLLLFNIATIHNRRDTSVRFPFDRYKQNPIWDIEHICARATGLEYLRDVNDQKAWLKDVMDYFVPHTESDQDCDSDQYSEEETGLINDIDTALKTEPFKDANFELLYRRVIEMFQSDEPDEETKDGIEENSISNLALLDAGTNRSYGNAVYPVKRKKIISKVSEGTFVPLCTINVFSKAYSNNIRQMWYWSNSDRDQYLKTLTYTLKTFFASDCGEYK